MTRPTDYRGFARLLLDLGAQPVRQKGSHEQWRLTNGRVFTLPTSRSMWGDRRTAMNRWHDLLRECPHLRG